MAGRGRGERCSRTGLASHHLETRGTRWRVSWADAGSGILATRAPKRPGPSAYSWQRRLCQPSAVATTTPFQLRLQSSWTPPHRRWRSSRRLLCWLGRRRPAGPGTARLTVSRRKWAPTSGVACRWRGPQQPGHRPVRRGVRSRWWSPGQWSGARRRVLQRPIRDRGSPG